MLSDKRGEYMQHSHLSFKLIKMRLEYRMEIINLPGRKLLQSRIAILSWAPLTYRDCGGSSVG